MFNKFSCFNAILTVLFFCRWNVLFKLKWDHYWIPRTPELVHKCRRNRLMLQNTQTKWEASLFFEKSVKKSHAQIKMIFILYFNVFIGALVMLLLRVYLNLIHCKWYIYKLFELPLQNKNIYWKVNLNHIFLNTPFFFFYMLKTENVVSQLLKASLVTIRKVIYL